MISTIKPAEWQAKYLCDLASLWRLGKIVGLLQAHPELWPRFRSGGKIQGTVSSHPAPALDKLIEARARPANPFRERHLGNPRASIIPQEALRRDGKGFSVDFSCCASLN
jgi:hypothetical protein